MDQQGLLRLSSEQSQSAMLEGDQYRPDLDQVDKLFITYPEDNSGHSLITCLTCGALFAVTVATEVYVGPPLNAKLDAVMCPKCGIRLSDNLAYYPETYVIEGRVHSFERSCSLPPNDELTVEEFDGIYES